MTINLSKQNIHSALERAGMLPPSPEVLERLNVACTGIDADSVLDIGFAGAPDDQPGGEALFVLTRDAILIVTKRKRGIFKAAEPRVTTFPYAKFKGFVEDDDLGESVMVLVGHSEDDLLAFSWGSASERHRMFLALWAAHNAAQRTA